MFQTGFPSIIGSSKLHIQRQVFVRPAASCPGNFLTSRESVSFTRRTPRHVVSSLILCLYIDSNFIFMCRVWQWNSKIFYNFNDLLKRTAQLLRRT